GLCLTSLGLTATRVMAPALFYLLFAIPLPNLVQAGLSQDLQLLSSTLGVWPLKAIGLSVFQEGNVIDLGGYSLQVVDACSGLRYIFPLMSFGYLIAFLYQGAMWKRVFLFLSTVPIAIFMNALRISAIGVTVNWWGIEMAEGLVHDLEGWVVFLGCTLLLMLEVWLLNFVGRAGRLNWDYIGLPKGAITRDYKAKSAPQIAALMLAALLAAVMTTGVIENRKEIVPAHTPLAMFPLTLSDWRGQLQTLDPAIAAELKLSDYWLADYARKAGEPAVNLYVAYYDSQRAGVITHTPASCIPGGGWRIESKDVKAVAMEAGTLNVSRILARRGKDAILVYYWFDQRGRNLTESYAVKAYLLVDSLTKGRTDGSLIRLVTAVGEHETLDAAEQRLQAFLKVARPAVQSHLPAGAR
ncbi:MAG TPA: VPLPA-CTERM-specific exosortase XrtD, partial [Rhodospirillaceae bacterium]|nr:VPLPA-CTERM-specific exosortase XrtD [Rhodospirillaceae bacterium]